LAKTKTLIFFGNGAKAQPEIENPEYVVSFVKEFGVPLI
jgi:hypothetical protein